MGNRLSKRVSGFGVVGGNSSGFAPAGAFDKTENYDYDACDQLTCVDGVGFEYDLNGNLAKKRDDMAGDMVYKFNYANRLREVLFADGTKAQYSYKSDGMRISHTDRTGKTTKYYWDNSSIPEALNEGDEDGNITLNLFPGTGFKSTKNGNQNSTQWRWFITDHLGSVIALTDNNGIVTDEYEYDEYGNTTQTKGSSYNPYRYTGQNYDETTGLLYLRARYYDSQTGRFVSRDPIGIRGGMNEYGYANENPVSSFDVLGLKSTPDIWQIRLNQSNIISHLMNHYKEVLIDTFKQFYIKEGYDPTKNSPNCSDMANIFADVYSEFMAKYSSTHKFIRVNCKKGILPPFANGHVALAVVRCPNVPIDIKNVILVIDPWNSNLKGMIFRTPMSVNWWKTQIWSCDNVVAEDMISSISGIDKRASVKLKEEVKKL